MENKSQKQPKMNEIKLEKVILNSGGIDDKLEKEAKLLEIISGRKVVKTESRRRIPSLGVRPGLKVGCRVTIRGEKAHELLKRLLGAVENQLKRKHIKENHFSFGIPEYIEIPGMEYQRDVGILGLDVTVVFCRAGKRVVYRRIRTGRLPKKQHVTENEIVEFMQKNFNTNIK
ncbi:50S ribosomal protein L5 [Candidatus Pacearchaeota archaeon]|nr:50S ribosomal protein L5 [Candidatus Pacearchaeota archaeon]